MEENKVEKLTKDYQSAQEKLQSLALQKAQFQQQKSELSEAQKRVKSAEGKIYYQVGGAIVETKKDDALKDIEEKLESIEMRLTIVNKQYGEASSQERKVREELRKVLEPNSGA